MFILVNDMHSDNRFQFLSNQMEYGRDDRFPFDFELNGFPFGSKFKGKTATELIISRVIQFSIRF